MAERKVDDGNSPAPRWPAGKEVVLPEDVPGEESVPFSNWMIPSSAPEDRPDTRGNERSSEEAPKVAPEDVEGN